MTADSEPVDPGVFPCTEPRWSVGDVFTLGRDRRYRILDVQSPTAAAMEDITAVWTVEPTCGDSGLESARS